MAKYNNQYAISIKPNNPNLHGLDTNYTGDGQKDIGGTGLGDIFGLDYDRNKIEQIFNEGTDAQYALMQKENQIAQNQYANNQFANQQSAIESLRSQRNEQIASGMARGLNAAQEQGTILGLQQEAAAGALELANNQQLEADKIAAEYADNVAKALQESNAVKQAMAQVAAQLYEADMLGYTGELSYLGQMDANASDRYGYELGLEGTKYSADKDLEGTKYNADRNLEGTKYAADKNLEGTKYTADKNYAAQVNAAAKYASGGSGGYGGGNNDELGLVEWALREGNKTYDGALAALKSAGLTTENARALLNSNGYFSTPRKKQDIVVEQPTKTITVNTSQGKGTVKVPVQGPFTTRPFYTSDGTRNRIIYK